MKRESDPGRQGRDAVFRSSRRVTFVVRSDVAARRISSAQVSRDPMGAMQVDVQSIPAPVPPALGLDGDWREIADELVSLGRRSMVLRFWNRETGDDLTARAVIRDRTGYIAAVDIDPDAGCELVELDRDLFALIKLRRAAIAVDLDGIAATRLVSWGSIADLFEGGSPRDVEVVDETEAQAAPAAAGPGVAVAEPEVAVAEPVAVSTSVTAEVLPDPQPEPEPEPAPEPQPHKAVDDPGKAQQPEGASRLRALTSPKGFPDSLQTALVAALRPLADGFKAALLFQVEYVDGQSEYLVGFADADSLRESALEAAVNSALSSVPRHSLELGITFMEAGDPMVVRISRVGLRLV